MARRKALPKLWLISDQRNDAVFGAAMARLPRGAGVIFRHYHLAPAQRRARFEEVKRTAHARGLVTALAGTRREAKGWGANLAYGSEGDLMPAHNLAEIARANRHKAKAIFLSPIFATQSHPSAAAIGRLRFLLLAQRARMPVIALGGMTAKRAAPLLTAGAYGWAAIDGLSRKSQPMLRRPKTKKRINRRP